MAQRLSDLAGQHQDIGGLIENYHVTAVGGETDFPLTFTDGNEEVYLNGTRLVKGAAKDYITTTNNISLNVALEEGDIINLIGRSAVTSIAQSRSQSETQTLASGQTDITFTTIQTDPLTVNVRGDDVDSGELIAGTDYTVLNSTSIRLVQTFPSGTLITGIQGQRTAWVEPSSMVVSDGTKSKDLASRFRDTKESEEYFEWSTGRKRRALSQGLLIERWMPTSDGLVVVDSSKEGYYPVLELNNVLYEPVINSTASYRVLNWFLSGSQLLVNTVDVDTGDSVQLSYITRIDKASAGTQTNPMILGSGTNRIYLYINGSGGLTIEKSDGSTVSL